MSTTAPIYWITACYEDREADTRGTTSEAMAEEMQESLLNVPDVVSVTVELY
jgi:hypothetical protein